MRRDLSKSLGIFGLSRGNSFYLGGKGGLLSRQSRGVDNEYNSSGQMLGQEKEKDIK